MDEMGDRVQQFDEAGQMKLPYHVRLGIFEESLDSRLQ